ncbi:hypothetical protein PIB30_090573 [Stylosanthes scabra]|uniref:Uncharacterized protein n=1 Tax=Stylosanthes scabra TaxID=79078 RepID=A0ABU6SUZ5_9FABA|nr:hypothetical protein [Stylosanthes scabra]
MYALALKGKTSPDLLTALSSSLTSQGSIPTSPWYYLIRFGKSAKGSLESKKRAKQSYRSKAEHSRLTPRHGRASLTIKPHPTLNA